MSKSYDDLVKRYPLLFNFGEGSQEPFALFGFECGIGWYNLINVACDEIYKKYYSALRSYKFWETAKANENFTQEKIDSNIETTKKLMEEEKEKLPVFVQIKEKFGSLRLYMDNADERANAIASTVEALSEMTCEDCGNSGMTYQIGWHKTLCPEHAKSSYTEEQLEKYAKFIDYP